MHPWPIVAEPSKYVCWLTDHGDYDEDHTARLFLLATLHPIDRFFMQTRRRVSLAERSVVSSPDREGRQDPGHAFGARESTADRRRDFAIFLTRPQDLWHIAGY
jgi:hypothetical protein